MCVYIYTMYLLVFMIESFIIRRLIICLVNGNIKITLFIFFGLYLNFYHLDKKINGVFWHSDNFKSYL